MDILEDLGPVFLGSRLKRLAERLQAGAAEVLAEAELGVQPSHMPVLAALDRENMLIGQLAQAVGMSQPGVTRSVAQLVELGLAETQCTEDQRRRLASLTPAGKAMMVRARALVWPRLDAAVKEICPISPDLFCEQIAAIEAKLAEKRLAEYGPHTHRPALQIRDYEESVAACFRDINLEWIDDMFVVEDADLEVLDHPQEAIIQPGGEILFVESPDLGVIGTCALRKTGQGSFELTKMGVRSTARGLKAGEFLLQAAICRAGEIGAQELYLLTNSACQPAIHLYEKLGFSHDAGIMERYGARYARCDVAMLFTGTF
ncbi:bifunctional helix-turn-helix transcriptional regulator/GNAT family N-acetyltransferase [Altericroceibacterium spongiae]|nr:bifunctional helix-turn-helix transcriptional regulator/GNAT family N-acetyltransferase [Altericroceibacterium spongiae]